MPHCRVLHVHTDLLGGGIEKVLLTLAVNTSGARVGICWSPGNHPVPSEEFLHSLRQRVELIRIPPPLLSPIYAVRLLQAIREFRPTVLHLHGASVGIIGSMVGRLSNVPAIVYTEHLEHERHALWLQKAREATAALPHHTVCVSEQTRRALLTIPAFQRIEHQISVIHNGIDLTPYRTITKDEKNAIRRELDIPVDASLIGSVGLLWHVKGYEYLLRAMPEIMRRTPQARLALVGSGEDESKLRQLAADLSIASRVHFMGWRADVPRILAALDVYVQPSLSEGLPMSVLEAAAATLPIVATDVGGVAEVIADGKHGILVVPGDEIALSNAVNDLLASTGQASNIATCARAHVAEHFSAQAMTARYSNLYDALLARSS